MDNAKIKEIISKHQHWLKRDCDGWENMKADLRGADLRRVDLYGVNLSEADLCKADLYEANLRGANLYEANLRGADLYGANLHGACLYEADLRGANLYKVDLSETDLYGANLRGACLYEADLDKAHLRGANLCGADLRWACLYEADLREADLYKANLQGATNVPFIPYACPDFGEFIGFKKAHDLIVVLKIPKDARRLSATGRKCRCDKAKVLEIQNIDGTKASVTSVPSDRDNNFVYEVDKEICVLNFDENRWNECSTGIHFFINRQEAVNYV